MIASRLFGGVHQRQRRTRVASTYFDPVPVFAGAVDGALAGETAPDPVVVGEFAELVVVAGALVWLDAMV